MVILAAFVTGTFGGATAGALAGWWFARRTSSISPSVDDYLSLDPDVDDRIGRAASEWARSHHQPEAAPFVADKLRLFYSLRERHQRRRGRGWSL